MSKLQTRHASPSGTRVLVVDDSDISRAYIQQLLESEGYVVKALSTTRGAAELIEQEKIDVLVVDVSMPEVSGDQLVLTLRQNPRTRPLAIIVVSGCASSELEQIRTTCGADDAVIKRELSRALAATVAAQAARLSGARTSTSRIAR